MEDLRIDVILGERLDLSSVQSTAASSDVNECKEKIVRTEKGREIAADLLVR